MRPWASRCSRTPARRRWRDDPDTPHRDRRRGAAGVLRRAGGGADAGAREERARGGPPLSRRDRGARHAASSGRDRGGRRRGAAGPRRRSARAPARGCVRGRRNAEEGCRRLREEARPRRLCGAHRLDREGRVRGRDALGEGATLDRRARQGRRGGDPDHLPQGDAMGARRGCVRAPGPVARRALRCRGDRRSLRGQDERAAHLRTPLPRAGAHRDLHGGRLRPRDARRSRPSAHQRAARSHGRGARDGRRRDRCGGGPR